MIIKGVLVKSILYQVKPDEKSIDVMEKLSIVVNVYRNIKYVYSM